MAPVDGRRTASFVGLAVSAGGVAWHRGTGPGSTREVDPEQTAEIAGVGGKYDFGDTSAKCGRSATRMHLPTHSVYFTRGWARRVCSPGLQLTVELGPRRLIDNPRGRQCVILLKPPDRVSGHTIEGSCDRQQCAGPVLCFVLEASERPLERRHFRATGSFREGGIARKPSLACDRRRQGIIRWSLESRTGGGQRNRCGRT